ncbi:hypothetical protein CHISP_1663 [Chitinispirillum alkaliphilum]|nr:hypothetical protein CHISP_1663 [Chitinispirillum alkaliphilum]
MESYVSSVNKKVVFYIISVLAALALPGYVVVQFYSRLPESTYVMKTEYLSPDAKQFRVQGFKENHMIEFIVLAHEDKGEQYSDFITFNDRDGRRLMLYSHNEEIKNPVRRYHALVEDMKTRNGKMITGEMSFVNNKKSSFCDDTYCVTRLGGLGVVQMISPKELKTQIEEVFSEMGILEKRTDIPPASMWLKKHANVISISFLLFYSVIWLTGIFLGGEWLAKIKPEFGIWPKSKDDLRSEILALNRLDIPFRIEEQDDDILCSVWKCDGKWKNLYDSSRLHKVHEIKMKLKQNSKSVSVMETVRAVIRDNGAIAFSKKEQICRSQAFFEYASSRTFGLKYQSGLPVLTGVDFTLDVQEIKNPLIEIVTASGWSWKPKSFKM